MTARPLPSFPLLHPLVPTSTPMPVTTGTAEENSWSGGEQAGLVFRVIVACQIVSKSAAVAPSHRPGREQRGDSTEPKKNKGRQLEVKKLEAPSSPGIQILAEADVMMIFSLSAVSTQDRLAPRCQAKMSQRRGATQDDAHRPFW